MKTDIENFVKIGNYIANESRKISLKYFKKKLNVNSKQLENFDPVTIADVSIQKKINEIISINYPKHSVLGEEATSKNPELKISWRVITKNPNKPLILDLLIEGLSLAKAQKEEFNSIIKNNDGDINALFKVMEEYIIK